MMLIALAFVVVFRLSYCYGTVQGRPTTRYAARMESESQPVTQPLPSQQQHVFTRQNKPPLTAGGQTTQSTKPAAITEANSLQLTRNLLRIAVYNIVYLRGLFPEEAYEELRTLGMSLKKLKSTCENSTRLVEWLGK